MKSSNVIGSIKPKETYIPEQKGTIVIADDDIAILDAMKLMLEFYNFEVVTIADGDIVPKLLSMQPKLLFLDICMSGVDGRDICRALKAIEATKDIPVIMISANCDLIRTAEDSGADDYLAKPFGMQDLLSKVNKYLLN
jgi:DNA-binding response OmpR family regulator